MTPDSRDQSHRGRRQSDQILDGWTWARVTKVGGALIVLGTIATTLVAFTTALVVTRPQLKALSDTVAVVSGKVDRNDSTAQMRFARLEMRQDSAAASRSLVRALARFQCIDLERQHSMSLASLAELPCDSLLRGVTR